MSGDDHLSGPQFYHGTNRDLTEVNQGMNHFSPSWYQAATFARRKARDSGGVPRVYPVQPTDKYGSDPNTYEGYRSEHPLAITGPGKRTPDMQGMRQMAKTYRSPEIEHGPLYVPPSQDPTYARDDWSNDWDH